MSFPENNAHRARIAKNEEFINDVLKEDLRRLEVCTNHFNEEIMEYMQLKNTLETLFRNMKDGYKTQVNIGGNIFMEARVKDMTKILVNIGKDVYMEMGLPEAIRFSDVRVRILTKMSKVVRDESVRKRSHIKMGYIAISEREKLMLDNGLDMD